MKDIDSENVGIRDGEVDNRDEGTGSTSCIDADTSVARIIRYVDQRENVNHTRTLDDIPIDEESGDEFELVGEGNHNVSYDTTGNNIIMSHPSVNENSKTNSNPKKRKSDQTGKENNDVEYTSFRNEIIETIEKTEAISMSERENLTKVKVKKSQEKYLNFANLAIQEFCDDIELDMNDVNTMLYACAKTVESKLGVKPKKKRKPDKNKKPKWKINIEKEIETMRGEMSILSEIERNKDPKTRKARNVIRKYKITNVIDIPSIKEELKQKIQVKAQRERRFDKRNKFYRQNKIFQTDAKKFYREIGKNQVMVKETPPKGSIENFWKGIWGEKKACNMSASWIGNMEKGNEKVKEQEWQNITVLELQAALTKSLKWKSPGIDKVPNFRLNALSSSHFKFTKLLNEIMQKPGKIS